MEEIKVKPLGRDEYFALMSEEILPTVVAAE